MSAAAAVVAAQREAQRVRDEGRAISARVLREMYADDPFWTDRFGPRGEHHAHEDGAFHVQYLAEAVEAGEPAVLTRYATWLRTVLGSRGMCSRHLAENFARLSVAFGKAGFSPKVQELLAAAEEALSYRTGKAGALEGCADEASAQVAARLGARYGHAPRGGVQAIARELCSYLADALATGSATTWMGHQRWLEGFLERSSRGLYVAIRKELNAELSRRGLPEAAQLLDGRDAKAAAAERP